MSLETARAVGAEFGLEVRDIDALELGSVNSNFQLRAADGTRYFARIYEEQARDGAERELALLSKLSEQGAKVVRPLAPVSGARIATVAGKPFAVFPWLEGEWLCLGRVTAEHCRKLGRALASVHLAELPAGLLGRGRFQPADMLVRLERVEAEGPPRLSADIALIRAKYAHYTPLRDSALPRGLCHGDLFRDNVLWQGGELAALLDFESVYEGPFVYDLLVTVLAWCFRDELSLPEAQALVSGYDAVRPLEPGERAAFEVEAALACLRFATTRLTDFELRAESAPPARDYRRFLTRLAAIESGALAPLRGALGSLPGQGSKVFGREQT